VTTYSGSYLPALDRRRVLLWLRRASVLLALGYAIGLVVAALALRYVGERWWVTTAILYLPRWGFALPLPVVVLALSLVGPRRLLWGTPLAVLFILFPLMGLETGADRWLGGGGAGDGPRLTVLSYNVATAQRPDEVAAVIKEAAADILLVQEYNESIEEPLAQALRGFHRHTEGQFSIASRFPLSDIYLPPKLPIPGSEPRSARFVRYRVQTPLGPLTVLNVHPVSPRNGFEEARGNGFLYELLRGRIGRSEGVQVMKDNSFLRRRQAEEIAAEAARSPHPVLIGGDTNMPGLSYILGTTLGRFTDGFGVAGRGFGYTYPADRPWMRIDRILVDDRLRFRRFETLGGAASDHWAVYAVISGK
jgi:endonuclease/exonuclease/phosphatase family metal-dependent hydrolase